VNDFHNYGDVSLPWVKITTAVSTGGEDEIHGGDGDDELDVDVETGTDILDGGRGADRLAWRPLGAGTLDLGAETLVLEGTKTVRSFENADGGFEADTMIGDENANVFQGWGGNDHIEGRGGDDNLYGGDSNGFDFDRYDGGDDFLDGGDGTDSLVGGAGTRVSRVKPLAAVSSSRSGVARLLGRKSEFAWVGILPSVVI
jgi:Ca2+-binding RTX toxin-like protein